MIKNAASRAFVTLAAAAALIGGGAVAANASVPRPEPTPTTTALRPVRVPVLTDVDVDTRRDCDRVTFTFRGDAPDATVRRVRALYEDPSGRRVRLPGRDRLLVRFEDARSRLFRGTVFTDTDEVLAWRQLGSFEGVVTVGVGLDHRGDRYFLRTRDDEVVLTVCSDEDDDEDVRPVR